MAWYYGTFSCGCEGRVNIIGPGKDREWKKERAFSKLCPECYDKHLEEERERKNKEAAEKAKEMELPDLKGSANQVPWANTLRQQFIDKIEEFTIEKFEHYTWLYREEARGIGKEKVTFDNFNLVTDYIITKIDSAKWFIDNRNINFYEIFLQLVDEVVKTDDEIIEEKTLEEVKAEATVQPQEVKHNGVVEIKLEKDKVVAFYEKNEDFRLLVKSLGYTWNGQWEKKISETTGTAEERAAELGNKLLNAGFAIMIIDEEVRKNAIEGVYEPECTRWIYRRGKGQYKGWLDIDWKERNDSLYRIARKLPGSKWDSGVMVKVNYYQEIEEFARLYGFRFTKRAQEVIDEYIQAQKLVQKVEPAPSKEEEKKDGLKEILVSEIGILPDLVDED